MRLNRRALLALGASAAFVGTGALAQSGRTAITSTVLQTWYRLVLELVRHTATYSPPVASRTFAYLGIAAYEALAEGDAGWQTFAGQVNALAPLPAPDALTDPAVRLHATMAPLVAALFFNTGPTGQRALAAVTDRLAATAQDGLDVALVTASTARGAAIAAHILNWSATDGGATIDNMGFPQSWPAPDRPGGWVPTSGIRIQQTPLLPTWGTNRCFAMANADACPVAPPLEYSEEVGSLFHTEAMEVHDTVRALTDEQKQTARFWSDDPMLSPTPPGHWIAIALQIINRDNLTATDSADLLARLGITVADAFIACWKAKFDHNLLRPVTYIKRVINPDWAPLLITPPFPEYPSGHAVQSGAAAAVLTARFGDNFAFEDTTHVDDGIPARPFASFTAAAEQATLSRLMGGIHFRAGCDQGLAQGRAVGAATVALTTRV